MTILLLDSRPSWRFGGKVCAPQIYAARLDSASLSGVSMGELTDRILEQWLQNSTYSN